MHRFYLTVVLTVITLLGLSGCQDKQPQASDYTGYIEANYFYIASPEAGWIVEQGLTEGQALAVDELVAKLDSDYQHLALTKAKAHQAAVQAQLTDLTKGARQEEVLVLTEQLNQQQQSKRLADIELARLEQLRQQQLVSQAELDKASTKVEELAASVSALKHQLNVIQLSARPDIISAKQQKLQAADIEIEQAAWQLQQRIILAKHQGSVEQIFYREGEYIKQGQPLISVMIPDSKKVRFYLGQDKLSAVKLGQDISVQADGLEKPLNATISFIAKDPEFTPPVLYGKSARDSLVFMVEAQLKDDALLAVGVPVDIQLND
ncbi:HlyD family secretion protein [Colwellia sp. MEBiC06753]